MLLLNELRKNINIILFLYNKNKLNTNFALLYMFVKNNGLKERYLISY